MGNVLGSPKSSIATTMPLHSLLFASFQLFSAYRLYLFNLLWQKPQHSFCHDLVIVGLLMSQTSLVFSMAQKGYVNVPCAPTTLWQTHIFRAQQQELYISKGGFLLFSKLQSVHRLLPMDGLPLYPHIEFIKVKIMMYSAI